MKEERLFFPSRLSAELVERHTAERERERREEYIVVKVFEVEDLVFTLGKKR